MKAELAAARLSAERLRTLVEPLDDDALTRPAYPPDWSVADVLSHLGSMAVIMRSQLEDVLAGRPTPEDFRQSVWDEWNTKPPRRKADDCLLEDRLLLERFESLTDDESSRFALDLGPLSVDAPLFLGMRVGEHAMHTWDVEVALDPKATVAPEVAAVTVEYAPPIARFVGKGSADVRRVVVHTTDPERHFVVEPGPETVTLATSEASEDPDLRLPTEAFARLFFGRLDAEHTPEFEGDAEVLADLRRIFPGF